LSLCFTPFHQYPCFPELKGRAARLPERLTSALRAALDGPVHRRGLAPHLLPQGLELLLNSSNRRCARGTNPGSEDYAAGMALATVKVKVRTKGSASVSEKVLVWG
jgi:hypothetical protein